VKTDAPKVISITTNSVDGYYKAGSVFYIMIQFSKKVYVNKGTGDIVLFLNSKSLSPMPAKASFYQNSNDTITFKYIVQTNENSERLNYESPSSLQLINGATIRDESNNNANLQLPSLCLMSGLCSNIVSSFNLDTQSNIIIDTKKPFNVIFGTISPLVYNETLKSPALTFSANPNDVDVEKYIVNIYESSDTTLSLSKGLSENFVSGNQIILSDSVLEDGKSYFFSIEAVDRAGNKTETPTITPAWSIDTTAPIASISGAPTGTSNVTLLKVSVGGANVSMYQYKIGLTTASFCDESVGYSSFTDLSTNITVDISGVFSDGSSITLCVVGRDIADNLQPYVSATKATWIKDATAPDISLVSTTMSTGIYNSGSIDIAVEFSKVVKVFSGVPTLKLNFGIGIKATYISGSNSNTLMFRYTIAANQATGALPLDVYNSSALELNGALIMDLAGNAANLNVPITSSKNTLQIKNIRIDSIPPTPPSSINVGGYGWTISNNQSPSFTFTSGTDLESGLLLTEVGIYDVKSDVVLVPYTTKLSSSNFSSLSTLLVPFNDYQFILRSKDNAGNYSSIVASSYWRLDNSLPTAPGTISNSAVPPNYSQQTPKFTFVESSDSISSIAYYKIQIVKKSDLSIVQDYINVGAYSITGLTYTLPLGSSLIPGETYFANIKAVDNAGNESSATQSSPWIALVCPNDGVVGSFTLIPAAAPYMDRAFCVAQFEMKAFYGSNILLDGDKSYLAAYSAISSSTGTPWVNLNRDQAITECQSLNPAGSYDLINNRQWQAIAKNAEMNNINWTSSVVGQEMMYRGHSDNSKFHSSSSLPITDISDEYSETGESISSSLSNGKEQRRTLSITSYNFINGENLWDVSGNVSEWIKNSNITDFGLTAYMIDLSTSDSSILWDGLLGNIKFQFGPKGLYTGLIQYGGFGYGNLIIPSGSSNNGIIRGGYWNDGDHAGVFSTTLDVDSNNSNNNIGFRCVYIP